MNNMVAPKEQSKSTQTVNPGARRARSAAENDDALRDADQEHLSDRAIAKLHTSGISEADAVAAGIFSVENAKEDVHAEFDAAPALVFPYYAVHGNPIFFERDGEFLPFVRVRYLSEPPAVGFVRRPAHFATSHCQAERPQTAQCIDALLLEASKPLAGASAQLARSGRAPALRDYGIDRQEPSGVP